MKRTITQNEILTRNPSPKLNTDSDRLFVGSLEKAIQVLYAFGGNEPSLTSTEIAGITGFNVSAVQRFTHTLTLLGLLEKDVRTKQYRLSARMLDFAYLYLRSDFLSIIAYPHLLNLSRSSGVFVNLSILDRADVIYVVRLAGVHGREHRDMVGGRMPSFLTSNGRIMLAYLPEDDVRQILDVANRQPLTAKSLVESDQILEKIAEAKSLGYCIVDEETEIGIISAAAPVFDQTGKPAAAVSVAVSKAEWPAQKVREKLIPLLVNAGIQITQAWSGKNAMKRL